MPFTSTPVNDTYSSKDIPISTDILLRPSSLASNSVAITQDAGMINLLPIKLGDQEVAITRPSITTVNDSFTVSGVARGFFVWEISTTAFYTYMVVGTSVLFWNGSGWTTVNTLTNNVTTPVRFAEFIDGSNTKKLILVDGYEGYVFTTAGGAGTKITDVNFPSPHVPYPVFLDGYIYLAKSATGDIYNSNLNDPTTWTAGNFISAEMYPDNIQALVRVNNYILAIGTTSSEYFYDAGNSPGTPLARVDGAALPFGTLCPNSIAVNKNTVVLLANNNDGQASITAIENQRFTDIGGNFIVPLLSNRLASGFSTNAGIRGYFFRHRSELFYGVTFSPQDTLSLMNPQYSPTFVYSFSAKKWTEFRMDPSGNSAFPVSFTQGPVTATSGLTTYCMGNYNKGGVITTYLGNLLDFTTISGLNLAADNFASSSSLVYQQFRTVNIDFGTLNRKFMSRCGVIVEPGDSNFSTSDALTLAWADDDYQTWTTVSLPLSVKDASSNNNYFPFVTQMGSFRRRAIRGSYVGKPLRLYKLEVDLNKGQQ
jgi:hypothetical protein